MDIERLNEVFGDEPYELVTLTGCEVACDLDAYSVHRFDQLMCRAEGGELGGNGTVREAYNMEFEHMALKSMSRTGDLQYLAFREEYETLLRLRVFRAFPTVYGRGLLGDVPTLAMEWIDGTSLAELEGKLSTEEVTKLARAAFALLEQIERLVTFFVHRDLTPKNIMVRTSHASLEEQLETGNFDLVFVDLGSATATGDMNDDYDKRTGSLRGATLAYAAPELLSTDKGLELRNSPKVDVYALSRIMWELLTGTLATADVDALDESAKPLAQVLVLGMEPDQAKRPTAEEMRAYIDQLFSTK